MVNPKEAYKKILEEHMRDLKLEFVSPQRFAWLGSRYHILEILGFKKNEVDTVEKVKKIIKKYNEEIEARKQDKRAEEE